MSAAGSGDSPAWDWLPLSAAPGGEPVLWRKALPGGRWRLCVAAGPDGRSAEADFDGRPVGVGWRPDGRALAFLRLLPDRIFGLFAWEFGEGAAPRRLPAPPIRSGFQTLRWNPRRFEILCRAGGLLVGVGDGDRRVYAPGPILGAGFGWHPDGERAACVSAISPGAILEALPGGKSFRLRRVVPRGRVKGWTWADGSGGILAAARATDEEWFRARILAVDGGDTAEAVSPPTLRADAGSPVALGGGKFAWEVRAAGAASVRLPDETSLADAAIVDEAVGESGAALVLRLLPPERPPELWRWSSSGGLEPLAAAVSVPPAVPAPEHVGFRSRSGDLVRGWLWWPTDARGAVVEVHGGPRLAEGPRWHPGLRFLARRGIACFAINYTGSSGYGRSGEESFDDRQAVAEIRAAVHWVGDRLPGGAKRIVLSGHCLGADLALEAGRAEGPDRACPVVVASPQPRSLRRWRDTRGRAPLRAAFFPERDPFFDPGAAEEAWNLLEQAPGTRRVRLAGEGHAIAHPESFAAYYGAALDALE